MWLEGRAGGAEAEMECGGCGETGKEGGLEAAGQRVVGGEIGPAEGVAEEQRAKGAVDSSGEVQQQERDLACAAGAE